MVIGIGRRDNAGPSATKFPRFRSGTSRLAAVHAKHRSARHVDVERSAHQEIDASPPLLQAWLGAAWR